MTAAPEKASQVSAEAPDPPVAEINRVLVGGDGRAANPVAAFTMFRGAVTAGSAHGVNRQANWQEAIGWLVKAAVMGNASAQGQIKVLAGAEDARVEGSWLRLARSVDIKGHLRAPSLTRVHESPLSKAWPRRRCVGGWSEEPIRGLDRPR